MRHGGGFTAATEREDEVVDACRATRRGFYGLEEAAVPESPKASAAGQETGAQTGVVARPGDDWTKPRAAQVREVLGLRGGKVPGAIGECWGEVRKAPPLLQS